MERDINLGFVQMEITQDLEKNLEKIINFIKLAQSEMIIFPELALTGYQNFRALSYKTIESALKEIQRNLHHKIALVGSPFAHSTFYTNAYLSVSCEGVRLLSEKELLFPGLDDKANLSPGWRREIFNYQGKKFASLICFELRSTEIARFYVSLGIDMLLVPAQWPEVRIEHFNSLLKARAIENQIFVAGINGIGRIESIELGGNSSLYSPYGEEIFRLSKEEALKEITLSLELPKIPYPLKTPFIENAKVKSLEELMEIVERRKRKGQVLVFTNGCFDLLHAGHVDYLQRARKLGDFLVVGLNSDNSIRKIKGSERPINSETFRKETLAGLSCVDYIIIFDEETPEKLIHSLKPDILVKGADWEEDQIVGADFVKSYGGKVVRLEFNYEISTTKIIKTIQERKIN